MDGPKVAGWGAAQFSCDTDDFGPSPHSMCNFPFLHKGEMHRKCSHTPTPGKFLTMSTEFDKKTLGNEAITPLITKNTLKTLEHFPLKLLDPQKSTFGDIVLGIKLFQK